MILTHQNKPMKARFTCILIIVFTIIGTAQNYQTIEEVDTACTQLGFMGDEEAEDAVDKILSQIGLFRNFTIQECPDINNAVAKNIDVGDGKKARYILYDNEFFEKISDKASNDWAATSILAHEIGHHLNGHSLNNEGSNLAWELEADEFSGFVLARMGSSLEDAQSAIKTLKREEATRTHPAKADRLDAIAKGWSRGSGKTITVQEVNLEEITVVEDEPIEEEVSKVAAQKVIANYIKAIGGEEKIRNFKTKIEKTTSSNMQIETYYLTPSKYISISGTNYYSLYLDGKMYQKNSENEDWRYVIYVNNKKNRVSFVWEYSVLINNEEVKYLGTENIDGIKCYAIQFPNDYYKPTDNAYTLNETFVTTVNYYSVDTGLLKFSKSIFKDIVVHKVNKDVFGDRTEVNSETLTSYQDYKEVKGVLLPFKATVINKQDKSDTETKFILEYSEIMINPQINKNDFIVKD